MPLSNVVLVLGGFLEKTPNEDVLFFALYDIYVNLEKSCKKFTQHMALQRSC